MFILAYVIELITQANHWLVIPHTVFVITAVLAILEALVYLIPISMALIGLVITVRGK